MLSVFVLVNAVLIAATCAGAGFLVVAAVMVRRFAAESAPVQQRGAAVTVLKPLCGDEPNLYENLRSFCTQRYPKFQVVFGVGCADDPAIAVVERLKAEMPEVDIALVVGNHVHGANLKISNVINMMRLARHDILVLCDSDMRARPDYLEAVAGALQEPGVGLVTCLYTGRPVPGVWSQLGAMFITHSFLPQVLVGRLVGARQGCFGATMALTRQTLERLGGFESLVDKLADDYALGAAVRALGLRVALSSHVIETQVNEPDFLTLWRHELRWGRTLRSIEPAGYAASIITQPLLPATLLLVLSGGALYGAVIFVAVMAIRIGYNLMVDATLKVLPSPLWLLPARDYLSVAVLLASFCGSGVTWRTQSFHVNSDGLLTLDGDIRP